MTTLDICLQRFQNMWKIKIQVSLKNYCLGQKHCQSISENQRKQVMNDWTAKAVLSSSRYSRFTVYGLPTIFYLSYFHVNLISPQKIRVRGIFSPLPNYIYQFIIKSLVFCLPEPLYQTWNLFKADFFGSSHFSFHPIQ